MRWRQAVGDVAHRSPRPSHARRAGRKRRLRHRPGRRPGRTPDRPTSPRWPTDSESPAWPCGNAQPRWGQRGPPRTAERGLSGGAARAGGGPEDDHAGQAQGKGEYRIEQGDLPRQRLVGCQVPGAEEVNQSHEEDGLLKVGSDFHHSGHPDRTPSPSAESENLQTTASPPVGLAPRLLDSGACRDRRMKT